MRWARRILLAAVLVALPVGVHLFVTRNSQTISIDYLGGREEGVAIWLALLASFAAGAVVASLVAFLVSLRLRLETHRYRKATRALEAELHKLRNLPLSDEAAEAAADEAGPGLAVEPLARAAGLERGT